MNDNPHQQPPWVSRGNRIRRLVAPHFCATITKVTETGFNYLWDSPIPISGSRKLCKGGEVFLNQVARYGHTLFEAVGVAQEAMSWPERMWLP